MIKMTWITDPHFNFISDNAFKNFLSHLNGESSDFFGTKLDKPDFLLIGGDIGEANSVCKYLKKIAKFFKETTVIFVTGNHDFYRSGIDFVNRKIIKTIEPHDNLIWLDRVPYVEITPSCAVIGHSGWSDGRYGNWLCSNVDLADYHYIADLAFISQSDRLKVLQELAGKAAYHIKNSLEAAFAKYSKVFLLTHVPPWREAAVYDGKPSDDDWAPHFSCKVMGDAINAFMVNCDGELTVLCGHTHGKGFLDIPPNIHVITGGSKYGHPKVNRVFDIA